MSDWNGLENFQIWSEFAKWIRSSWRTLFAQKIMTNWKLIVESHHNWAYADGEYRLVIRPPATPEDLCALEDLFGPALSGEMRSFYHQIDGFGIEPTPNGVSWFVTPIAQLPELIEDCRSWFRDTHPDLAVRFFPFIDWISGDYTGYLLSEKGSLLNGLYTFEHELYRFDAEQDSSEFILTVYDTIRELLIPE